MRAWMCLRGCGCKDVPGSQMKCPRGFRLGGKTITTPGSRYRCFNTTVLTGCCWSIADALAFVAFSVRGNRPARAATRARSATWPRLPNLAAGNTRPAVELCGPSGPRLRSAAPSSYRGAIFGVMLHPLRLQFEYLGVTADSSPLHRSSMSQWRRCQPVRVDVARAPEPREMLWPSRYHGCAVHNPTFSTNTAGGLYPE